MFFHLRQNVFEKCFSAIVNPRNFCSKRRRPSEADDVFGLPEQGGKFRRTSGRRVGVDLRVDNVGGCVEPTVPG